MSLPGVELLVQAITRPASVRGLSPADWDLLLRQGRVSDSLARLASRLQAGGVWDAVPLQPQRHLLAALKLAQRQHVELTYEVQVIHRALAEAGIPLVLLKGAAYVLAGRASAAGRMVSDVDILVPQARLADAESALMKAGWITTTRDAYDQHYYRTWMHEIPPLQHVHRGSVVDVHHAVVPPTAGYGLDSAVLLGDAVPVDASRQVWVLNDWDMVLHSAVHLMHEGELEMGFRGLLDLDALVTELSKADGFWPGLCQRAIRLKLQWPLFLALRYMHALIGTPVPSREMDALRSASGPMASPWRIAWLDFLYRRALRPVHPSVEDRWSPVARQVLYLRSHGLRMPIRLLIPHLLRKSLRQIKSTLTLEKNT